MKVASVADRARSSRSIAGSRRIRTRSKKGPKKGYVAYPQVNMTAEMVDALVATRAYEANIGAMELSKNMAQQSLRILG